jgi:hypothetical protein
MFWQYLAIIWRPFFASVYLLVSQIETNIWPSICASNKKTNTQIKNGHFVVCICVSGQWNHLFCKTNTQICHYRVKPLQCNVWPSFAYLHIRASVQRNHSLRLSVPSQNEIAFCSGLWRASERLHQVPLWTLESFGGVASLGKNCVPLWTS